MEGGGIVVAWRGGGGDSGGMEGGGIVVAWRVVVGAWRGDTGGMEGGYWGHGGG